MNEQQKKLQSLRETLMSSRRVICTGNPNNSDTLAHGFKKIFPTATFIHLTAGWDLTDQSEAASNKLKHLFLQHNTFINCSYIAPYVQSFLLEVCNKSVKFCDVFNIGSTYEYDRNAPLEYQQSKLDLRNKSLQFNTYRFQSHHIALGRINRSTDSPYSTYLDIDNICNSIIWLTQQPFKIPLICIDNPKDPW
jgi:hypothetical protein